MLMDFWGVLSAVLFANGLTIAWVYALYHFERGKSSFWLYVAALAPVTAAMLGYYWNS